MATPRRGDILLVASVTFISTIGVGCAFAKYELAQWWVGRPASLAALASLGLLLSIAGATLPHRLSIPPMRISSKLENIAAGATLGVVFGLGASAVGWIAAAMTVWALLAWFFVVAFILGAVRIALLKCEQRAG